MEIVIHDSDILVGVNLGSGRYIVSGHVDVRVSSVHLFDGMCELTSLILSRHFMFSLCSGRMRTCLTI